MRTKASQLTRASLQVPPLVGASELLPLDRARLCEPARARCASCVSRDGCQEPGRPELPRARADAGDPARAERLPRGAGQRRVRLCGCFFARASAHEQLDRCGIEAYASLVVQFVSTFTRLVQECVSLVPSAHHPQLTPSPTARRCSSSVTLSLHPCHSLSFRHACRAGARQRSARSTMTAGRPSQTATATVCRSSVSSRASSTTSEKPRRVSPPHTRRSRSRGAALTWSSPRSPCSRARLAPAASHPRSAAPLPPFVRGQPQCAAQNPAGGPSARARVCASPGWGGRSRAGRRGRDAHRGRGVLKL